MQYYELIAANAGHNSTSVGTSVYALRLPHGTLLHVVPRQLKVGLF
jgi:hypothetical protein